MSRSDAGHDISHVRRVVHNAIRIGEVEHARVEVYLPAAWLHDCVYVPKNSPKRSKGSALATAAAEKFLRTIEYPTEWIGPIAHCIHAHSFSANIDCETLEARIVQDADRLEALGAIGLARCLMTGGSMGQRLYHPEEPFPIERTPNDAEQSIDHFFAKLLKLHATMKTDAGRHEAIQRTEFLIGFLKQFALEIGVPLPTEISQIGSS